MARRSSYLFFKSGLNTVAFLIAFLLYQLYLYEVVSTKSSESKHPVNNNDNNLVMKNSINSQISFHNVHNIKKRQSPDRNTTSIKKVTNKNKKRNKNRVANTPGSKICQVMTGLVKKQKKICAKHPELMQSIYIGLQEGVRACQHQFKHHRWNCTTDDPEHKTDVYTTLMDKGTRESAYLLAIISASFASEVTKACSRGLYAHCGCDGSVNDHSTTQANQKWAGCSDNIAFGYSFSRNFIDAYEKRTMRKNPPLALTKLHNNNVGRHIVKSNMVKKCKCHGVSGSCEVQTCWRALPHFPQVAETLQQKYDEAVHVEMVMKDQYSKHLVVRDTALQTSLQGDPEKLVFLHLSPDFCTRDDAQASLGTFGRPCNHTSNGPDSCRKLCCERGYTEKMDIVQKKCQCKFVWCCDVKCNICTEPVQINTCM